MVRRIYVVTGYRLVSRVFFFLSALLVISLLIFYLFPRMITYLHSLPVQTAILAWELPWSAPVVEEPLASRVDMQGLLGSQIAVVEALGRGNALTARSSEPLERLEPAVTGEASATLQTEPARENQVEAAPVSGSQTPGPLVLIYNTHNAETYIPTDGVAKKVGRNSGVSRVSQELYDILTQEYRIPAVLSDTIHDYPDFSLSYTNSARTVQQYLEEYPSLQVIVDVHRDAGLGPLTATWQGEKAAEVLFVVGSDAKLEHPHWKDNLAFARRVNAKLEDSCPGISRGVRVQDGRYNQHLHPHALLVEVGTAENSLEEALCSAKLLAQVLAEIVKEDSR